MTEFCKIFNLPDTQVLVFVKDDTINYLFYIKGNLINPAVTFTTDLEAMESLKSCDEARIKKIYNAHT